MTARTTLRRVKGGHPSSAAVVDDERDRQLMKRVAARDREAFRELYHFYHRRLARFLTRLTHRHEIAEEIINDTLWIVWRKAPDFRGRSLVSTWILGIAYRCGLKTLRRQHAIAASLTSRAAQVALAREEDSPADEGERELESALAQLPVEQRVPLELAYVLGYSLEEIAEIMSCPVNTVKTRMFYARQKLKAQLGGHER
jgi:RNA polymerase sigma-70 factor, ECF subfamily